MASQPVLDLESLLAPIPGDNPAGAPLRYTGDYDEIRNLLPKPDRDAFEAGGQEGQWSTLVQLACQKLREKSKDLQIACWLIEALVHGKQGKEAFAGLRDGFQLLQKLCEQYWDGLYPLAADGDLEARAAPLTTLLEARDSPRSAARWIGEIPLTKDPISVPDTGETVFVSYNLYHAIKIKPNEDKLPLRDAMESVISRTPTDFLKELLSDIQEAITALNSLKRVLNERFGPSAPGAVGVAEMLDSCRNRVASVLKERGVGESTPEAAGEEAPAADAAPGADRGGVGSGVGGPLRSREDALVRLREVADFFRRTEPHSPLPYLIQRAINWSQMSFDQLILELVKDENARSAINSTLGISLGETSSSYGGNGEEGNS
jgi:type VI secretion system protein ImpA